MPDRSVLVVCSSRVIGEALTMFLQKAGFDARGIVGSLGDVGGAGEERDGLTLAWLPDGLGASSSPERELTEIRNFLSQSPSSRIIVLGLGRNAGEFGPDFQAAGAAALLPWDVGLRTLVSAVELIALGRGIFPTGKPGSVRYAETSESQRSNRARLHLLGNMEAGNGRDVAAAVISSLDHAGAAQSVWLSRRERETLERLVLGLSNKEIARALRITEATVKVHVKALLRKINASNRTQLAIWGWHAEDRRTGGAPSART